MYRWSGVGALALCACVGKTDVMPVSGASDLVSVDAGADCHVVFTYHSTWPIRCDDAGNCWFIDASAE